MSLIVQKYGGTSVGSVERIKSVAQRVLKTKQAGHDVVVVVSAMAGETDRLLSLAHQINPSPTGYEQDLLLATGEQVTVSLLGMSLDALGQSTRCYLGSQVRILTDGAHTRARIQSVDGNTIINALKEGHVVVIAGFQGVTEDGHVTTLGRGGSDTSAVAIAASIRADLCEIYTDVDGVYTTDPRICPQAQKLKKISHEEMLELASVGSKVLQIRSVELAANYNVNLVVRSSFNENEGTMLVKEEPYMEKIVVSGIAIDESTAKISLRNIPDLPGTSMQVFGAIAKANINVDMIVQNTGEQGRADLSFTMPAGDFAQAQKIVQGLKEQLKVSKIEATQDIAKVTLVGVGMRSHAGVAAKAFSALAQNDINIDMISTSEIKISVLVKKEHGKKAVQILHDAFGLASFPF